MSTLEDYETKLHKSGDEIIHLVSAYEFRRGSRIAYCGFDTTGRTWKEPHSANCVVCLEMSGEAKRLRDEYLESICPSNPSQ